MAARTFKCPNCGGELLYEPASGRLTCPYCASSFSREEAEAFARKEGQEVQEEQDGTAGAAQETYGADEGASSSPGGAPSSAVLYSCPSCGAQIVTEETTAASFCYYCHNPVVFDGKLSGEYLPDKVIPFSENLESAKKRFLQFAGSKRFVPKAFFRKEQIEKMTGVYYPFWEYDCEVRSGVGGTGTKVRTWTTGEDLYTETSFYDVRREGDIRLNNMCTNALKKNARSLVEEVQPFELDKEVPFSMGYLSGFMAERRDIGSDELAGQMRGKAKACSESLLRDTVGGYATVNVRQDSFEVLDEDWSYLLLPVWVLTYAGPDGRQYYFAMNGQTGAVRGELPVDRKKLALTSLLAGLAVAALVIVGGLLI